MELRRVVESSLLLAGGFILHQIMPPLVGGMKPDLSLLMLFIIILLYQDKKLSLLSGMVAGIISALSSSFPGGQVANLIDKPITAIVVLAMVLLSNKFSSSNKIRLAIIGSVGTMVSGSLFLGAAALAVALPQSFITLFVTVVLPSMVLNTVFLYLLYPIVVKINQSIYKTETSSQEAA